MEEEVQETMEEPYVISPSIDKLPIHILVDILSYLPIKSLIHCKFVCKSFLSLISGDREFLSLHLSRSSPEIILCTPRSDKMILLDCDHRRAHELPLVFNEPFAMTVLNSSRGLLCLRPYCYTGPLSVFNPVTLEFTLAPCSVNEIQEYSVVSYGFGYTPISDQYKVLRLLKPRDLYASNNNPAPLLLTEIYTLGHSVSWRRVEDAPNPMVVYNDYDPTLLNGSLHWMIKEFKSINSYAYMISFDLNNEKYGEIALPPFLDIGNDRKHLELVTLGVFEGWLSLCVLNSNKRLDVWVMKEYGVGESWVKEIVVETSLFFLSRRSFPVKYVNNRDRQEVLFFNGDYGIFTYKVLEKKIGNCIKFTGWRPNDDYEAKALIHVPILMPLEEIVVGAQVHRLTGSKSWRRCNDLSFSISC